MLETSLPLIGSSHLMHILLYPLVVISGILFLYHSIQQRSRRFILGNIIPGPPGLPLVGNVLDLRTAKTAEEILIKSLKISRPYDHHGIVRLWVGPRLVVCCNNPDDVESILGSSVHIDKPAEYGFFKRWFGNGLLISTGEIWRTHRKLIAPTFHLHVLKSFITQLNAHSNILVERLNKQVGGKSFDVHDYVAESTVDILLETVMGVSRKEQTSSTFDYAIAAMKMCDIIHSRLVKVWYHLESINNCIGFAKEEGKLLEIIHKLSSKVFNTKKEEYLRHKLAGVNRDIGDLSDVTQAATKGTYFDQSRGLKDDLDDDVGEKKRLPFLEHLIDTSQNGGPITEKQIKEQVDTIMFEGHDTVSAGASFVICVLGAKPDIQDKVLQELDEIFGDSDRPATFNDTLNMKYLERVILETLRMFPPVPMIARLIKEEIKLPSGYILPAETTVIIAQFKIHRLPEIYPNPEEFNPDNFLPENMNNRHYYAYIPFSAGPRSCVGRKYAMLKLKVMISTILRNYKVISDIPIEKFALRGDVILKRADGFMIRLENRKKTT